MHRGHRAYLSSAPHYDFPRYRQLVHEITVAFSSISREVLSIAGRLRDELARPDLAQHLARLQDREQEKLQLVSEGPGGGHRYLGLLCRGLSSRCVPAADSAAPAGPAAGTGPAPRGCPSAGGAGAQAQVGGGPAAGFLLPPFWDGSVPHGDRSPLPTSPLPLAQGGPDGAFSRARGRSPGEGLAMLRGPLGLPGLSVS